MHPTDLTLNEYVDGALGRGERADVARHLESCAGCRQLVEDLREIGRAASALEPIVPPVRVWAAIQKEVHGRTPDVGAELVSAPWGRGPSMLLRGSKLGPYAGSHAWIRRGSGQAWLAAAAVVLLAVFIGIRFTPFGSSGTGDSAMDPPDAAAIEAELQLAEEHYQNAIAGLERIADSERTALDPDTAATLQKNLAVINDAISESRAAVRAEPQSQQAQFSLIANFKMKLALLQDTVALINELRAGNDAAAARIVSGS
jgi:putative zinc finger protein